ncbi:MAG: ATP-binding protein [Bdellovibrionota bacterium]
MTVYGKPIRVLLVDDDEDDFLLIRDMFNGIEDGRASLKWTSDYSQAVEMLSDQAFDIYLVDYRLGEKTGFDFMEEASKLGIRAPMILLTGAGDRSLDMEAMRQGAADYLVKGTLTSEMLERSIRYSLKAARDLERIREREENFRRLFDFASEGMIVHEIDGVILDVNATAGKIFGCSTLELIGKDLDSLFHATGSGENYISGAWSRAENNHWREAIAATKNGQEIFLELYGQEIKYHGKKVRLTSVRDVTEKREMEHQTRLQDRLASVGLLTSGLAHEIGNPMAVIQMRAGLLARQVAGNEKAAQNVKIIGVQLERINKLVRSLLNFARGTGNTELESVNVGEAVNDVLSLMTYEFQKQQISVSNEIDEGAMFNVKGETGAMHQVLLNLFINAAHAIESAGRASRQQRNFIRISAVERGDFSELRIEDSGCGIPKENMKNLFRPFFSTKEIGKGTGLGLSTCHRIIQDWGGSIQVESEIGQGTTFRIALPKAVGSDLVVKGGSRRGADFPGDPHSSACRSH